MDSKTILVINLSILFLFLNLFEIAWSQPINEAVVKECATKIGDDCGDMVLTYVLMSQKTSVTKECCTKLIQSGRTCHNILIEPILDTAKQFAMRKPQMMERQNEVWIKCEKDGHVA